MVDNHSRNDVLVISMVCVVALVAVIMMLVQAFHSNATADPVNTITQETGTTVQSLATGAASADTAGNVYVAASKAKKYPKNMACIDTDKNSANPFNVKGNITGRDKFGNVYINESDYCRSYDSNVLVEYGCANNFVTKKEFKCPVTCKDGACVTVTPSSTCKDTDGGINLSVKGTVTSGRSSKSDQCTFCTGSCLPGQQCDSLCGGVIEYYCSANNVQSITKTCQYGCKDGACSNNPAICGDNIAQPGELCDGTDLRGLNCAKVYPQQYKSGDFVCNQDCQGWSLSNCIARTECSDKGYSCTSQVRGCGLNYNKMPYACTDSTICCENVSYCGDGICDTTINYPIIENSDTCPQDCKATNACKDSDGGKNFFVKGYATGLDSNDASGTASDTCYGIDSSGRHKDNNCVVCTQNNVSGCYDSCSVDEAICVDNTHIGIWSPNGQGTDCPNGCYDGACISPTSTIGLKDYPSFYFSNNDFNGLIVIGKNAPADDVLVAVDIAQGLLNYPGSSLTNANPSLNPVAVGIAKLDSDVTTDDWTSKGFIVVGNICNNMVAATIYGWPQQCDSGYSDGIGRVDMVMTKYNNPAVIVQGFSETDIKAAGKVLADWKGFKLSNIAGNHNDVCVYSGGLAAMQTFACLPLFNETPICTDNDGGLNYDVQGTVHGIASWSPPGPMSTQYSDFQDYCFCEGPGICVPSGVPNLNEMSCVNGLVTQNKYTCPNGCSKGACLSTPATTCPKSGVQGKLGNAAYFDGSDYLVIASNNNLVMQNGDPITVSAWINPTSFSSYNTILTKDRTNGQNSGNYALRTIGTGQVEFYYQGSTIAWNQYTTNEKVALNTWSHIVVTYTFGQPQTIKVYINGQLKSGTWTDGTGASKPLVYNEPMYIGAIKGMGIPSEYFKGSIDEISIWRRILSNDEVTNLYAGTSPTDAVSMVLHLSLDEAAGASTFGGIASCNGNTLPTCTDSDGGFNYYVKGTTTGVTRCVDQAACTPDTTVDSCYKDGGWTASIPVSNNAVFEGACTADGYRYGGPYECPNGCKDGACITPTNTSVCDSMGGVCNWNSDCCSGTCVRNRTSVTGICTTAYTGKNCTDTDNGDIYVKGTTFGLMTENWDYAHTIYTKQEDICDKDTISYGQTSGMDPNTLYEYYCNNYNGNDVYASQTVHCANGCKDGACIKSGPYCDANNPCPMIATTPPNYRECNGNQSCNVGGGYNCVNNACVLTKNYYTCNTCPNGCSNGICIGGVFNGGTTGLSTKFVAGSPPDTVFDAGQSAFSIVVALQNLGETTVNANGGYVKINGLDPSTYGVSNFKKSIATGIDGIRRNYDGSILSGGISTVEFSGLSYKPSIQGNLIQSVYADVCYDYSTRTSTAICIDKNPVAGAKVACTDDGPVNPQNSGAPIQISSVKESFAGNGKIGLTFIITHKGNGDNFFDDRATLCNDVETNTQAGKVHVVIRPLNIGGTQMVTPVCLGLSESETLGTNEGYLRLFKDSNGVASYPLYCTLDVNSASGTLPFVTPIDVVVSYKYLQHVSQPMTIRHVASTPVCGNGICEAGEDNICPVCTTQPCPMMACQQGTCPQDCATKPDLVVDDIYYNKTYNGMPNILLARICNKGGTFIIPDSGFTVSFTINNNQQTWGGFGKETFTSGSCREAFSPVYFFGLSGPGYYYITANVDQNNNIIESNEANNKLTKKVYISDISTCVDSDGGDNMYTKGACIDNFGNSGSDYCDEEMGGTKVGGLEEINCQYTPIGQGSSNIEGKTTCVYTSAHTCPNGCKNGACLKPTCVMIDCAQPPPGCNYQNPTHDGNGCITSCGTLVCTKPVCNTIIDCAQPPAGCNYQNPAFDDNGCAVTCGTLVCPTITCSDSDGGMMPLTKGVLTQTFDSGVSMRTSDFCLSDIKLAEYYCDGNKMNIMNITCSGSCYDGACVSTQNIALSAGWNIISTYLKPVDPRAAAIFKDLVASGNLIMVKDENGNSFIPSSSIDQIGSIASLKGYQIKVTNPATLTVLGTPISGPWSIQLPAGWSYMGFPNKVQNGLDAFSGLIQLGVLQKVQDENGNAIENLAASGYGTGWINNIGDLKPGEGYAIKVSQASTLVINN